MGVSGKDGSTAPELKGFIATIEPRDDGTYDVAVYKRDDPKQAARAPVELKADSIKSLGEKISAAVVAARLKV